MSSIITKLKKQANANLQKEKQTNSYSAVKAQATKNEKEGSLVEGKTNLITSSKDDKTTSYFDIYKSLKNEASEKTKSANQELSDYYKQALSSGMSIEGASLSQKAKTLTKSANKAKKEEEELEESKKSYEAYIKNEEDKAKYANLSTDELKSTIEANQKELEDFYKNSDLTKPYEQLQAEAKMSGIEGKNDEILYYDDMGSAVTYDSLYRTKLADNNWTNLTSDTDANNLYAKIGEEEEELKNYQAKAQMQSAYGLKVDPEYARLQSQIQKDKEALANMGYDYDETAYYEKYKADKASYTEKSEEQQTWATDGFGNSVLATVGNIIASPIQGAEFLKNAYYAGIKSLGSNESVYGIANIYDDAVTNFAQNTTSAISNQIEENVYNLTGSDGLAWLASNTYSGVESAIQSKVQAAVCNAIFPGAGEIISLALMGSEAANGAFQDSIKKGRSNGQALATSIAAWANEMIFEKLSLENYKGIQDFTKNAVIDQDTLATDIKYALGKLLVQSGVEGSEEVFTDIANAIADGMINGNLSDYSLAVDEYENQGYEHMEAEKMAFQDFLGDLIASFYGGFVGGFMGSGGQMITEVANTNINHHNLIKAQDTYEGNRIVSQNGVEDLVNKAKAQNLTEEDPYYKAVNQALSKIEGKDTDNMSKREKKAYSEAVGRLSRVSQTMEEHEASKGKTTADYAKSASKAIPHERTYYGNNEFNKESIDKAVEDASKIQEESMQSYVTEKTDVEGKTIDIKNGKEIKITKIKSIGKDGVILDAVGTDGIDAKDVKYGSLKEAFAYEYASKYIDNVDIANQFVQAVNNHEGSDIELYAEGLAQGVRLGKLNIPVTSISKDSVYLNLSPSQQKFAYNLGKQDHQIKANKNIEITKALKDLPSVRTGKVTFDQSVKTTNYSDIQKISIEVGSAVTKEMSNTEMILFESVRDADGKYVFAETIPGVGNKGDLAPNGAYVNGKIYIDINAGNGGEGTILWTMAHELTHFIQEWSPVKYQELADFLVSEYSKTKVSIEDLVSERMEKSNLTYDEAFDEVVADAMQSMLTDTDAYKKIKALTNKDRTLAEKIKDALDRIILAIRKAYDGLFNTNKVAYYTKQLEGYQKLSDMFAEALADAGDTYSRLGIEGGSVLDNAYSDTAYSVRPPFTKGAKLDAFVESLDENARETYDLLENIHNIGQVNKVDLGLKSPQNIAGRYMTAKEWNSLCESNPKFRNVAKKLASSIPKEIKMSVVSGGKWINDDGTLVIGEMESKLKMKRSFIQRVIDSMPLEKVSSTYNINGKDIKLSDNDTIMSVGGDAYRRALLETVRAKYRSGELKNKSIGTLSKDTWGALGWLRGNQKTVASGDFSTLCPQMFYNFGCWYCYRRASLETNVDNANVGTNIWYTGEILYLSDENIKALNATGGLRIQSFGDWFDQYASQLADVIADAKERGLQVKIVTKEVGMVKAVAKMKETKGFADNVYFNISADYTLEEQGRDIQGEIEARNPSRPFIKKYGKTYWKRALAVEEAAKLREQYPFVKVRIVATTLQEFLEGLKSSDVQVVTGYHGRSRSYERISSATGETLVEVEPLGDHGMPRFEYDIKSGEYKQVFDTDKDGKTIKPNKWQQNLADEILKQNLVAQYYAKSCCTTGNCLECKALCGLSDFANAQQELQIKNTYSTKSEVAYWQTKAKAVKSKYDFNDLIVKGHPTANAIIEDLGLSKVKMSPRDKQLEGQLELNFGLEGKMLDQTVDALQDLTKYDNNSKVKTLAVNFREELINKGEVLVIGKTVKDAKDMATVAQVFRDPRFETTRYFFTDKNGKIVLQSGITTGIVSASNIVPKNGQTYIAKLTRKAKELGAVKLYFLHNHPSGDPTPSSADIGTTKTLQKTIAHYGINDVEAVVINSNKYAYISNDGIVNVKPLDLGEDKLLSPVGRKDLVGNYIHGSDDLALYGKKVQLSDDHSVAVYLDAKLKVKAVQEVNNSLIADEVAITEVIEDNLVKFGSEGVAFITTDNQAYNNASKLVEVGMAFDSILKGDGIYSDISARSEGIAYGSRLTGLGSIVGDTKFSNRDSEGNELTEAQATYFKDSKVRDSEGNLLVVYHGTPRGEFYTFDPSKISSTTDYGWLGKGFYFTSKESVAKYYAGYLKTSNVIKSYLNITNPFVFNMKPKAIDIEDIVGWRSEGNYDELSSRFTEWLKDNGYDGVKAQDEYMIFESNQAKLTDNVNPTSSTDIRYSNRDSEGNVLSDDQQKYFENSKIRDENGNLLVVYHGTDQNFTVFDKTKGRSNMDIQGMFFSPWKIDAEGYGSNVGTYYLNITNPASESIGYKALNKFKGQNDAGVKAREYLISLGYDGVNNGNEEYIAFSPNQIKNIDNQNPTANPDVRYSLRTKYDYDSLVSKPDMEIVDTSGSTVVDRRKTVKLAKENLIKQGATKNNNGSISIRVLDSGDNVVVGNNGLEHGLKRNSDAMSLVTQNIGAILKNSIKVNELYPKMPTASQSYILIGAANLNGDLHIVRSVVNRFTNNLDSVDVLYAANAKKETVALNVPLISKSDSVSTISIAELLDVVKNIFPDILSMDVLNHFGITTRPNGELGESAKYSSRDEEYLKLAQDPEANETRLREMVDQVASEAGYVIKNLYHGTQSFGFTEFDPDKMDDGRSIFATDDLNVAQSYVEYYDYDEDPWGDQLKTRSLSTKPEIDVSAIQNLSSDQILDIINNGKYGTKYHDYGATYKLDNESKEQDIKEGEAYLRKFAKYYDDAYPDYENNDLGVTASSLVDDILKNSSWGLTGGNDDWFKLRMLAWDIIPLHNDLSYDGAWDAFFKVALKSKGDRYIYVKNDVGIGVKYLYEENVKADLVQIIGEGIYGLYGRKTNLLEFDADYARWNDIEAYNLGFKHPVNTRMLAEKAEELGYSGLAIKDLYDTGSYGDGDTSASTVYIFFDPADLKSNDLVTYDDEGKIIPLSERFNRSTKDLRFSKRDSEGGYLSIGQQKYFADSKVRDNDGNLRVMYHGTRNNHFDIFDTSIESNENNIGSHFGSEVAGQSFADEGTGELYKVYLNITNPYETFDWFAQDDAYPAMVAKEVAEEIGTKEAMAILKKIEALDPHYAELFAEDGEDLLDEWYLNDKERYNKLYQYIRQLFELGGYDGLSYYNDLEDSGAIDYVAFYPEQIKYIDNLNPSINPDIRFSDRDLGYHAGDLGKSTVDDYYNQGYGRGTGHFGFGTYFVGDEAQINIGNYGKRPHEKVDFSNYNLFKVRNDREGYELHDALKGVDGYIERLDEAKMDREALYELKSKFKEAYDDWEDEDNVKYLMDFAKKYFSSYEYDRLYMEAERQYNLSKQEDVTQEQIDRIKENTIEARERFSKNHPEAKFAYSIDEEVDQRIESLRREITRAKEYYSVSPEQNMVSTRDFERDGEKVFDNIDSMRRWYSDMEFLAYTLGKSKEEIYEALDITADIVKSYSKNERGLDSAATVFMKTLGYEGVDVRGTGLDNTGYGSVIYDLKGDDLARKQEIGTAKYSERDPEQSTRYLLANALESLATNDLEKKKLANYKAKVESMNEEQAKLKEIKAEIKEMSFGKGERDQEKLKELKAESTKISNRISNYDRQLLNLESTTPLKNVLNKAKQDVLAKAKADSKDAMARQRARSEEQIKAMKEDFKERTARARDSRTRTELRHSIIKKMNELSNLLRHPTKDKHVPEALRKSTALALEQIDLETKWSGAKTKARLEALRNAYAEIKNEQDPIAQSAYDPGIVDFIDAVKAEVGETSFMDMSVSQLEYVYEMYSAVHATIVNANKTQAWAKKQDISEIATDVESEIRSVSTGKDKPVMLNKVMPFLWNNLKPVYAFRTIGSDTFTKLYENVRSGEDTFARDVSEAKEVFQDYSKKYNYKAWDMDETHTFRSKTGEAFDLNLQQMMSIYAYSKRDQAYDHLDQGGFVFKDSIYEEKHGKITIKYQANEGNAYNLSRQTIEQIKNALTEEQRSFVDAMQQYLSVNMGSKGNAVSMQLYDIRLFKEKNYFPLKSDKNFITSLNEPVGEAKIKNSSFTNALKPHANNPIVLENFMDVWANHVGEMSMYHAFTLPLEDFNRVFNYKAKVDDTGLQEGVKQALTKAYGKASVSYISDMLTSLNGGARSGVGADILSKMVSLAKKGSVFASASVTIQQPSAIARAWALVDPKYFVEKNQDSPKKHDAKWAELKKYAPVAIIKEMGYFDTNVGKSTSDWITSLEYDGIKEKALATIKDDNYRDELLSKAPALADELAWVKIWDAVKLEVADTNPELAKGSEEYMEACGRRFTEVITRTQVYDSVLSRSGYMRSKDTLMKNATAFMAEPTTTINMLADSVIQFSRDHKIGNVRKTVGAVVASALLNAILESFVKAARDDDDDKTYLEKYLASLVGNATDSINPLTMIPIVKDIYSIAQGYDVERMDMSVVSDLYNGYKKLFSSTASAWRKVEDFGGAVAQFFGLPLKNIMRDLRSLYNVANDLTSGKKTTGEGIKQAVVEELTGDSATAQYKQSLAKAIKKEDTDKIKSVIADWKAYKMEQGKTSDEARSAIQSTLTSTYKPLFLEAYAKGDNAEMIKIRKMLNATGIYKDIVETTQNWIKQSKE